MTLLAYPLKEDLTILFDDYVIAHFYSMLRTKPYWSAINFCNHQLTVNIDIDFTGPCITSNQNFYICYVKKRKKNFLYIK